MLFFCHFSPVLAITTKFPPRFAISQSNYRGKQTAIGFCHYQFMHGDLYVKLTWICSMCFSIALSIWHVLSPLSKPALSTPINPCEEKVFAWKLFLNELLVVTAMRVLNVKSLEKNHLCEKVMNGHRARHATTDRINLMAVTTFHQSFIPPDYITRVNRREALREKETCRCGVGGFYERF